MRETKRQMIPYSFYDRTGIERHLTRMAEKGWLLCKIGFFWRYRRIEPKKLSFCVCYFPRATVYDPGPSEGQEEFYEFCAHAGWTLAGASGQLQVFYNERENPVPIDTAPELELEAIHQSAKKTFLPPHFLLLGLGVLNLFQYLWRAFDDPITTLSSVPILLSLVSGAILIWMAGTELIAYFLWRRRALAAAERGEFLPTRSHFWFQWLALAILLSATAWQLADLFRDGLGGVTAVVVIGLAGLIAAVSALRAGLKKGNFSAQTNQRVTAGACVVLSILFAAAVPRLVVRSLGSRPEPKSGDLPLTVGDLLEADFDYSQSLSRQESPLLAHLSARQSPWRHEEMRDAPSLDYGVTVVKTPFLYGTCKSHVLGWWDRPGENWIPQSRTDPVDPAPWGAEEAYQVVYLKSGPQDKYVLCYPDRIVEIGLDWTPTPEQMAVIGGKLGRGPL